MTLTMWQRLETKHETNRILQERINQKGGMAGEIARAVAMAAHAEYPQYRNHWDNYQLMTVTKDIKTKAGQAFRKGDLVIVDLNVIKELPLYVTAYSVRNSCDTSIPRKNVI